MRRCILVESGDKYFVVMITEDDEVDQNGEVVHVVRHISISGPYLWEEEAVSHIPEDVHVEQASKLSVSVSKGDLVTKVQF